MHQGQSKHRLARVVEGLLLDPLAGEGLGPVLVDSALLVDHLQQRACQALDGGLVPRSYEAGLDLGIVDLLGLGTVEEGQEAQGYRARVALLAAVSLEKDDVALLLVHARSRTKVAVDPLEAEDSGSQVGVCCVLEAGFVSGEFVEPEEAVHRAGMSYLVVAPAVAVGVGVVLVVEAPVVLDLFEKPLAGELQGLQEAFFIQLFVQEDVLAVELDGALLGGLGLCEGVGAEAEEAPVACVAPGLAGPSAQQAPRPLKVVEEKALAAVSRGSGSVEEHIAGQDHTVLGCALQAETVDSGHCAVDDEVPSGGLPGQFRNNRGRCPPNRRWAKALLWAGEIDLDPDLLCLAPP